MRKKRDAMLRTCNQGARTRQRSFGGDVPVIVPESSYRTRQYDRPVLNHVMES